MTDANTYTYTVSGTPDTPATGTIKATGVVLEGLSNASGIVTESRSWTSAQPITGRVRKSSGSPYYKTGAIDGEVSTTAGFSVTVQMIKDE